MTAAVSSNALHGSGENMRGEADSDHCCHCVRPRCCAQFSSKEKMHHNVRECVRHDALFLCALVSNICCALVTKVRFLFYNINDFISQTLDRYFLTDNMRLDDPSLSVPVF